MLVVDTNVLIYAANRDSPFHPACNKWLELQRAKAGAWYSTWPIVYEFMRVTTHPGVMHAPWTAAQAWSFIKAIFAAPGFSLLAPGSRQAEVLDELLAEMPELAGNIMHDAHTVSLMREHGVRQIVTRDTSFHRFKNVDVVDPVAG